MAYGALVVRNDGCHFLGLLAPMTRTMTPGIPSQLLAAADWLVSHGWHQHNYGLSDWYPGSEPTPTACCVVGALAVANSLRLEDEGLVSLTHVLAQHLGLAPEEDIDLPLSTQELWERVLSSVAGWNDAGDQQKENVVASLRAAAHDFAETTG